MFLTLRAQSKSDELGGEQGQLTLYIDSDHLRSLEGFTCGTVAPAPDDHDRRITIAYQSARTGFRRDDRYSSDRDLRKRPLLLSWRPASTVRNTGTFQRPASSHRKIPASFTSR